MTLDGQRVFVGGTEGGRLWTSNGTFNETRVLSITGGTVVDAAFKRDTDQLVLLLLHREPGMEFGTEVAYLELDSGEISHSFVATRATVFDRVSRIAPSADAFIIRDKVWDLQEEEVRVALDAETYGGPFRVALGRGGAVAVLGHINGLVTVWNLVPSGVNGILRSFQDY